MKRILIVCLLGMGLLLPATTITAKEIISKRIFDVWMEGDVLIATSDATTGALVNLKVWNSSKQMVLQQGISGYYSEVDLSSLPTGYYTAVVTSASSGYSENVHVR